jgi:hypothetical protein
LFLLAMHNDLYPPVTVTSRGSYAAVADVGSFDFPDGDISLLVESTSFRVHRDKLVRHSHVFDDMFIVAHPDTDEREEPEVYPGVSVRMPDTVEEWRLVFSVLYPQKQ